MSGDMSRFMVPMRGGKQYMTVAGRLLQFRCDHPTWGIVTEAVEINATPEGNKPPFAIFRACIFNEDGRLMATGTKMEDAKGFGDWLEKAETGSVGRALVMLGYCTDGVPELDEEGGFADSPIKASRPHPQQEQPRPQPMQERRQESSVNVRTQAQEQKPAPAAQTDHKTPSQTSPGYLFAAEAKRLGMDILKDGQVDSDKAGTLCRAVLRFEGTQPGGKLTGDDYAKATRLLPAYAESMKAPNTTGYSAESMTLMDVETAKPNVNAMAGGL